MPQFDLATYPSQVFWLVLSFCLLLVILKRVILPCADKIYTKREEKIQGDLLAFEKMEEEFLDKQQQYLIQIEAAKKQAMTLIHRTMNELEIFETEQLKNLQAAEKKQLKDFQQALDQERKNLEHQMKVLVDEFVKQLLPKLLETKER